MITIQELLFNRGLDRQSNTKLVRHKSKEIDLYNLYRTDKRKFLKYQQQQGRDVFNGIQYIISFIGEEGTLSRFIGVYRILRKRRLPEPRLSVEGGNYRFLYEISEVSGYEDLIERVIINWGNGAIKWHQGLNNLKEVVEIQPGLHYKQFTDYFDFILDFRQLKEICTKQYPDWKRMLSATKGIYLISDTKTGKLYVGAAYGDNGIWGRWTSYVSTKGHGGNKKLKELVGNDYEYAYNFQFSILMLFTKNHYGRSGNCKGKII
jgi:hypothetical protein